MTKQAYIRGSGGKGLGHAIGMMSDKMAGGLHGQCTLNLTGSRNGEMGTGNSFWLFLMPWNDRGSSTIGEKCVTISYLAFRIPLDL